MCDDHGHPPRIRRGLCAYSLTLRKYAMGAGITLSPQGVLREPIVGNAMTLAVAIEMPASAATHVVSVSPAALSETFNSRPFAKLMTIAHPEKPAAEPVFLPGRDDVRLGWEPRPRRFDANHPYGVVRGDQLYRHCRSLRLRRIGGSWGAASHRPDAHGEDEGHRIVNVHRVGYRRSAVSRGATWRCQPRAV